jgi:RNA polymerase sigma-70 factor (ECF subfamily)
MHPTLGDGLAVTKPAAHGFLCLEDPRMDGPEAKRWHDRSANPAPFTGEGPLADAVRSFHERFVELFEAHQPRLLRVLVRLSGEPELAADLIQEAFVRLYRRGALPEAPEAWLITVALNQFRNERATRSRRLRLLGPVADSAVADPPPSLEEASASVATQRKVRAALERLPERDQRLLVLRAEGYRYRDIATALEMNEASVGTLLARARRTFLAAYEEASHAPR